MTAGKAETTATNEAPSRPSLVGRVSAVLLRLALVVLLGVALGAGSYFGVTFAVRQLGAPTRENAARIVVLEAQLAEAESRLDEQQRSAADVQAMLDDQGGEQDRLASQLTTLTDQLEQLNTRIEADPPAADLQRDLQLTQAMLSLVRARLWLVENNLGLAIAEIERARELLQPLADAQPGADNFEAAIERLDFALIELNTRPLVAADDIEIAWKLLIEAEEE
ncbi:MAG: hypothetical protein ACRDHG_02585 [Anaerolineales bacterium]